LEGVDSADWREAPLDFSGVKVWHGHAVHLGVLSNRRSQIHDRSRLCHCMNVHVVAK
jgi:hypothetical protein